MNEHDDIDLTDTSAIIEAFGGIRPMAHKLDVPVSTVQGWKQRDTIPENRAADILAAANTLNVDLSMTKGKTNAGEDTDAREDTDADRSEPDTESTQTAASPVIERASEGQNSNRGAFVIAVVALIVAVGFGGWSLLGGGQDGSGASRGDFDELSDRLAAVEDKARAGGDDSAQRQFAADLAGLRAELDSMTQTLGESSPPSAEISELNTHLSELDTRLRATETKLDQVQRQATSETRAAAAALATAQEEIAQLRQQLDALDDNGSNNSRNVSDAVGLALAAGRLQRALDNGAPYQDVLTSLRALSKGDATMGPILDRIAGQAGTGVPTRQSLTGSFASAARDIVAAGDADAADGWTDRTLQRIRSVASVRRIGADTPGDTPEARVARAEAKLTGGDLAGAIGELNGLDGAAASAAAPWLTGARARLDADAAVSEIEALAIARLQSGNGGS
jgi:hypothetical protein